MGTIEYGPLGDQVRLATSELREAIQIATELGIALKEVSRLYCELYDAVEDKMNQQGYTMSDT